MLQRVLRAADFRQLGFECHKASKECSAAISQVYFRLHTCVPECLILACLLLTRILACLLAKSFLILIEAAGVADVFRCAVGHTGDY